MYSEDGDGDAGDGEHGDADNGDGDGGDRAGDHGSAGSDGADGDDGGDGDGDGADGDGGNVIQHVSVNALDTGRNANEVLRTLQALKAGGLTGCEWQPGEDFVA